MLRFGPRENKKKLQYFKVKGVSVQLFMVRLIALIVLYSAYAGCGADRTKNGQDIGGKTDAVVAIPPAAEEEPALSGTTYYVANNGKDSNAGTKNAPWATLQQAANQSRKGDTILAQDGAYAGFFTVNSGAEKDPIVFKANGKNVVIHSKNAKTPDNVNVENTDYTVIDGFIVKNAERGGIRVAESKGVIIRNNVVGPCGRWCLFTGFAPEVQILNNKAFGAKEQHGIYVSNSRVPNDNPLIRGNETYGNNYSGIQVNGDCESDGDGIISGAVIEGNVIRNNFSKAASLISMQDSVVRNNLIYNNGITSGAGGIHLTDESDCGKPSSRNLIVNNTILEPRIAGIRITDGAADNVIFNNIIFAPNKPRIADEVGESHVDKDSNLTIRSIPDNLFANPAANDYHLMDKSIAIDAGKTVFQKMDAPGIDLEGTQRPQRKGMDLGAFELKPAATP